MSNLTVTILLIASLAIFFGYVTPTYRAQREGADLAKRSIAELKEEEARYAEALDKTREIERERTGLLEKYNAIPLADRERLEKLLPDHIDSVRLIIDINNIASQHGMTLKNIALIDDDAAPAGGAFGPQEDRVKAVGLRFTVSGLYDEFRAFLKDVEQSLRLVDIRTVAFTALASEYEYSVTLSTYKLNVNTNAHF